MTKADTTRRGPWSGKEDDDLRKLIELHGTTRWTDVAKGMETRTPKQCRERWTQNLNPTLRLSPITPEEGKLIEKMVREQGTKWANIARELGNRSDNLVKNWYNGGQNRRNRKEKARLNQQSQHQQQHQQPRHLMQSSSMLPQQPLPLPSMPMAAQPWQQRPNPDYYSQPQQYPAQSYSQYQRAPYTSQDMPANFYAQQTQQQYQQQPIQQHPQYAQQMYSQQQQHQHPNTTYNDYATANGSTSGAPSMTSDGSSAPNVSPHTPTDAVPAAGSSYDTTSSYPTDHYDTGPRWQHQQQSSYGYPDSKSSYNGYYASPSVAGDYSSTRNALPSMRGPIPSSRDRAPDVPELRHQAVDRKEPGEKLAPFNHARTGSVPKPLGPYVEASRNLRPVGPSMPGGVNLIN